MAHTQERDTHEEAQPQAIPNLQMQALMGEMRRMLRLELEPIHERLDRVDAGTPRGQQQNIPKRQQGRRVPWEDIENDEKFEEFDEPYLNRGKFGRRGTRNREDDNMSSIKMKIPSFQGKSDPEAYLEWEKKMEFIFDCHNYSETKKVKLAVIEFSDDAIIW